MGFDWFRTPTVETTLLPGSFLSWFCAYEKVDMTFYIDSLLILIYAEETTAEFICKKPIQIFVFFEVLSFDFT